MREESEKRVEMKQLREVWRSCARDDVEANESYFVLNQVVLNQSQWKSKRKGVTWANFEVLQRINK